MSGLSEKEQALWDAVKEDGIELDKTANSLHIFEQFYLLDGREVSVCYEICSKSDIPCSVAFVTPKVVIPQKVYRQVQINITRKKRAEKYKPENSLIGNLSELVVGIVDSIDFNVFTD